MVDSIIVVGVLTLLHSVCDLKAAQTNMQWSLIWELRIYEFELGNNLMEANKEICCEGEGTVDHSASNQMVQEILLGLQGL